MHSTVFVQGQFQHAGSSTLYAAVAEISPQGMLHLHTQLRQNAVGDIGGVLRNEKDTHAFGADQFDDSLHLLHKRVRCLLKNQVGFVDKNTKFGLLQPR